MLALLEKTMLGDVPGDWNVKPLRDILAYHSPGDWGDERGPNMLKVVRSTNLTNDGHLDLSDVALRSIRADWVPFLEPKASDILLERSGGGPDQPVGRVGFVETDLPGFAFSNFLHLLRADERKVNARYLGWVLHRINRTGRILRLEQQTTQMRNLHFRDYLSLPIGIPSEDEQAAIARILDAADEAIARTRTTIEKAQRVRAAVVQACFADHAVKSAESVPLNSIADVERGKFTPRPRNDPHYYGGDFPFIQTGEITGADGRIVTRYTQTLNEKGTVVSRGFPVDTIAITIAANIGKTAILGIPMYFPDSVVGIVVHKPHVPRFIELCLRRLQPQLEAEAPQSAQKNLNLERLRPLRIPVPTPEVQRRVAEIYEAADQQLVYIVRRVRTLERLKRGLMQDLLTGRVRCTSNMESNLKGNEEWRQSREKSSIGV